MLLSSDEETMTDEERFRMSEWVKVECAVEWVCSGFKDIQVVPKITRL